MKRKMIMVLAAFLALLLVVGLFFLIKYIKETKQRTIELGYRRQNFAFRISPTINILREYDKQYHGFEELRIPGYLYASVMLYNHDTGHTFSVEQIKEYLSKEYEDDGSLRVSRNYPEIQDYIDFICYSAGYSETGDNIYPEEDPFESPFFYPFGRLKRFEIGLQYYARAILPEPYNHGVGDEKLVPIGAFPEEIVGQAVNWVFESGWMDLQTDEEYDAWNEAYREKYQGE